MVSVPSEASTDTVGTFETATLLTSSTMVRSIDSVRILGVTSDLGAVLGFGLGLGLGLGFGFGLDLGLASGFSLGLGLGLGLGS